MTDGDGLPASPAFSGRRSQRAARLEKFARIRQRLEGHVQTERLTWESVCMVQAPMGWMFDFTLEPGVASDLLPAAEVEEELRRFILRVGTDLADLGIDADLLRE